MAGRSAAPGAGTGRLTSRLSIRARPMLRRALRAPRPTVPMTSSTVPSPVWFLGMTASARVTPSCVARTGFPAASERGTTRPQAIFPERSRLIVGERRAVHGCKGLRCVEGRVVIPRRRRCGYSRSLGKLESAHCAAVGALARRDGGLARPRRSWRHCASRGPRGAQPRPARQRLHQEVQHRGRRVRRAAGD
jgi:hypothetical protein